jgi:WhiB family transcriptional regulator, redox-sensing transcriptional regulator
VSRSGPAHETSTRETTDWRDLAACADHDRLTIDDWFPDGKTGHWKRQIQEAKNVCWLECDVRMTCKAYSFETRQPAGIWGGMDEDERAAELRRRSRARQKEN